VTCHLVIYGIRSILLIGCIVRSFLWATHVQHCAQYLVFIVFFSRVSLLLKLFSCIRLWGDMFRLVYQTFRRYAEGMRSLICYPVGQVRLSLVFFFKLDLYAFRFSFLKRYFVFSIRSSPRPTMVYPAFPVFIDSFRPGTFLCRSESAKFRFLKYGILTGPSYVVMPNMNLLSLLCILIVLSKSTRFLPYPRMSSIFFRVSIPGSYHNLRFCMTWLVLGPHFFYSCNFCN